MCAKFKLNTVASNKKTGEGSYVRHIWVFLFYWTPTAWHLSRLVKTRMRSKPLHDTSTGTAHQKPRHQWGQQIQPLSGLPGWRLMKLNSLERIQTNSDNKVLCIGGNWSVGIPRQGRRRHGQAWASDVSTSTSLRTPATSTKSTVTNGVSLFGLKFCVFCMDSACFILAVTQRILAIGVKIP